MQVGERRAPRCDDVPQRGVAAGRRMPKLVKLSLTSSSMAGSSPLFQNQVPEAADDCGVVLLGSHGILLSARPARIVPGPPDTFAHTDLSRYLDIRSLG